MSKNFNIVLGKKIRESRKERNISLNKLASAMGVSYQQLQKYETGANRISAERLFQMGNVLHLKAEFFFPDHRAEPMVFESAEHRIESALSGLSVLNHRDYIADIVEKTAEILRGK